MKKQNRYKITHQIEKQILTIARDLPELQQLSKSGKPLFRANPEFKGTDLKKEDYYAEKHPKYHNQILRKTEPVLVNHVVEMRDRYQKSGQDGIDSYVSTVHRIVENSKVENEPATT